MARTLTKSEREVWKRYRKTSKSTYPNCKVNQLNIDCQPKSKEHRPHELAKFNLFYNHTEEGHVVITEAFETPKIRRDIVCLSCNMAIEIDNSTRAHGHRHPKNIDVFWYDLNRWRTREEALKDDKKISKGFE